jgi:hypothetical protein
VHVELTLPIRRSERLGRADREQPLSPRQLLADREDRGDREQRVRRGGEAGALARDAHREDERARVGQDFRAFDDRVLANQRTECALVESRDQPE